MKEKKIILTAFILVLIAFIGIGIAYAWYAWNTTSAEDKSVNITIGDVNVRYNAGTDINKTNLIPVSDKSKGIVKPITIGATSPTNLYVNLNFNITNIDDGLKNSSFKWALYQGSSLVKGGDMSSATSGSTIALLTNASVSTTDVTYTFYLWIDGNENNPSSMYNQNIIGHLKADVTSETPTS